VVDPPLLSAPAPPSFCEQNCASSELQEMARCFPAPVPVSHGLTAYPPPLLVEGGCPARKTFQDRESAVFVVDHAFLYPPFLFPLLSSVSEGLRCLTPFNLSRIPRTREPLVAQFLSLPRLTG